MKSELAHMMDDMCLELTEEGYHQMTNLPEEKRKTIENMLSKIRNKYTSDVIAKILGEDDR